MKTLLAILTSSLFSETVNLFSRAANFKFPRRSSSLAVMELTEVISVRERWLSVMLAWDPCWSKSQSSVRYIIDANGIRSHRRE